MNESSLPDCDSGTALSGRRPVCDACGQGLELVAVRGLWRARGPGESAGSDGVAYGQAGASVPTSRSGAHGPMSTVKARQLRVAQETDYFPVGASAIILNGLPKSRRFRRRPGPSRKGLASTAYKFG